MVQNYHFESKINFNNFKININHENVHNTSMMSQSDMHAAKSSF